MNPTGVTMAQVVPIQNPASARAVNLLATIGNTPLLRLEKIASDLPGIEIYGKAEYFNPGGSVKDRRRLNMILDGERSGRLTKDRIILDATSGNTGIAYAMIGAAKGYGSSCACRPTLRMERKRILKAYGAEMVFSDRGRGLGWRHPAVPQDLRSRSGPLLLSRSVQQSGELEGAFRGHRAARSSSRPADALRTS